MGERCSNRGRAHVEQDSLALSRPITNRGAPNPTRAHGSPLCPPPTRAAPPRGRARAPCCSCAARPRRPGQEGTGGPSTLPGAGARALTGADVGPGLCRCWGLETARRWRRSAGPRTAGPAACRHLPLLAFPWKALRPFPQPFLLIRRCRLVPSSLTRRPPPPLPRPPLPAPPQPQVAEDEEDAGRRGAQEPAAAELVPVQEHPARDPL